MNGDELIKKMQKNIDDRINGIAQKERREIYLKEFKEEHKEEHKEYMKKYNRDNKESLRIKRKLKRENKNAKS